MAWLSSVSWVTGDTPVLATVLNNIGADIRTLGGNVDGAGNSLLNLGGLRVRAISGTGNAPGAAFFGQSADGSGVIIARDSATANPYELWLGVNQATGYTEIQGAQGGVGFRPLILNRQGGFVGIGTPSPAYKFHVQGGRGIIQADGEAFGLALAYNNASQWMWHGGNAAGSWIVSDYGGNERMKVTQAGIVSFTSIPVYANNAAAITGGLAAGALYRTGANPDPICIVH